MTCRHDSPGTESAAVVHPGSDDGDGDLTDRTWPEVATAIGV
jgi:hypothetical protein